MAQDQSFGPESSILDYNQDLSSESKHLGSDPKSGLCSECTDPKLSHNVALKLTTDTYLCSWTKIHLVLFKNAIYSGQNFCNIQLEKFMFAALFTSLEIWRVVFSSEVGCQYKSNTHPSAEAWFYCYDFVSCTGRKTGFKSFPKASHYMPPPLSQYFYRFGGAAQRHLQKQ